ncbi:cdc42 effector protein 5 [Cololabis saira]|uniref:cdc42 effector protein 5 n=1 Tax=Cololabis saira TaxID=129043 RepID=UPI002AD1DE22|nr:cdc42 effector protein 5 [Cololabis saira]
MPLHKSTRGSRLDPTMISAPLDDFRHTMHIGRGGDTFGDTSFLATLGPSPPNPDPEGSGNIPAADPEVSAHHGDLHTDAPGSLQNNQLHHSESMSSITMDLDLDLDLGPSMLGDVLGVMDGLTLDCNEDVPSHQSGTSTVVAKPGKGAMGMPVNTEKAMNVKNLDGNQMGDRRIPDGNDIKPKGLRPKVRFSDKREEIIRQASEEEEGNAFDYQEEDQLPCHSPVRGENEREKNPVGETELTNHRADLPPSPGSSHSSEYDAVTPLDRRRVNSGHSETDSEEEEEEEEEAGRGYTFEDESDDEIGL